MKRKKNKNWASSQKRKQKDKRNRRDLDKTRSISAKIILSFLKVNFLFILICSVLAFTCYLLCIQNSDIASIVKTATIGVFGEQMGRIVYTNPIYYVFLPECVFFLISSFYFSVDTLVNFNKTWKSLSAINSDTKEVSAFSKDYSDLEIKLLDIKHDVFKNKQTALQAESKKNDLVMYLAHDLKTPLTSVIGYLSLLDECPNLPREHRAKYIGISLDKAYRLEELINEFFEITRFNINTITLENNRVNICMLLSQMVEEFYPMVSEKNVRIELEANEKIITIADSDKIARVFDNLLKNAVNYCYENSEICIGARIINDNVVVKFRNQCDEIPQEKLNRLFEKFYRMDSSRTSATGGSGLGLTIAKQIVELHGGRLSVKSTPEYTDFTVTIPYINVEMTEHVDLDFDEFK